MFLLAWGWPIVLVLHLLWGQDRRRLNVMLLGYLGLLAGVCLIVALGDTPPLKLGGISIAPFFVPVIYWGTAGFPALFLALFLLRGIRAVGPVLLVFMIFAMGGAAAGVVAVSTLAGMNVVVDILVPLGLFSPSNAVLLPAVAGMVLVVPFGWIAVDLIRRGYEAKCLNDTSIVFDSIWLFQTLSLFLLLFHSAGRAAWSPSARSSPTGSSSGSACGRSPRLRCDGRRPDCCFCASSASSGGPNGCSIFCRRACVTPARSR